MIFTSGPREIFAMKAVFGMLVAESRYRWDGGQDQIRSLLAR
jgi:hypothetical protein